MRYHQNKETGLIEPESTLPYELLLKDRRAKENEEKLSDLERQIAELKELMKGIARQ